MLDLAHGPRACGSSSARNARTPAPSCGFTDIDGHRLTCFATSTKGGQLADLELRHRRRARCEDRIRCAKDTGLRNLPLHGYAQNQIWTEIVALACELLAWMRCSPWTARPADGNPEASAPPVQRSRAPRPRRPPPGPPGCQLALGYPDPHRHYPAARPSHRLTSRNSSLRPERIPTRARGTPLTRRGSRTARHDHSRKTAARRPPSTKPRSRKMQARARLVRKSTGIGQQATALRPRKSLPGDKSQDDVTPDANRVHLGTVGLAAIP